jgi:large subunit ribosomal protein L25
MKSITIEGKSRSEFGKKSTRQLRSEGMVPAVIYGGKGNIHFYAPTIAFRHLVYTPHFQLAEINVDGTTYRTIMKDIQFDVVTDELNHIDFLELVEDRKVIADLPIKYTGTAEGVKAGGQLVIKVKSLKVRTYPKYLTENIVVNIENLKLNENIRVEDVKADNMELMNSPRVPIASVTTTRALRQADNDAAAAAPAKGAAAAAPAAAKATAKK